MQHSLHRRTHFNCNAIDLLSHVRRAEQRLRKSTDEQKAIRNILCVKVIVLFIFRGCSNTRYARFSGFFTSQR